MKEYKCLFVGVAATSTRVSYISAHIRASTKFRSQSAFQADSDTIAYVKMSWHEIQ